MPTPYGSSSATLSPQELLVQRVLTCFGTYARIRSTRGALLTSSRVGPCDEERAFDNLQQAITRLRAFPRDQDPGENI